MLNSQHLTTFKLLVELKSFTKTANQLGITQPAVSQHMQKLEQELGCELLIRHGRKIELTVSGAQLYRHACDLSNRYQAFIRDWESRRSTVPKAG